VAFNDLELMFHLPAPSRDSRPLWRLVVILTFALALTGSAATPVITGFSPAHGRPGTQVTITGSGFSDPVLVEFGDQRKAAFVRISNSQLVAVVPEDGVTAPIRVTPASGSVGTSAGTFVVAPRIDDFSPGRGSTTTTVTINGANFISGANNTIVRFGSVTSSVVNVTAATQLRVGVPAGISNAVIYVSTLAGTATSRVDFVSTTLPVIEEFSPLNGLPGKSVPVVINGANFTPVTSVKFNGVNSPFTRTADTQISTTIPANATTGKITVTGSNGTGTSELDFIVGPTIDNDPPFFPPFNPMAGKPGEFVVIYGNDFSGLTNVSFNGVLVGAANLVQTANNQVQAKIPAGATTGKVRVLTTNGVAISPVDFTIGPLIESLSKTNGPVGSDLTIYGAGFTINATQVKFGTVAATPFSYPANNQFIVKVPNGATNAPITVSTSIGTNVTPYKFLVTTALPLVDDFEPKSGPQGTAIQIRGAKFTGATSVTIGGVPVVNPQITADTLILATVPPGVKSGPVRVSNGSGTGVSVQTFHAPPWVSSVNPLSGKVGDFVALQGTNLLEVQNVYFGPAPAVLSSITANGLLAQLPLGARTGPVTLHTPGGSFVSSNTFVVLPRVIDFQPRLGPVGATVTITGTSFYNVTNVQFNGVSATHTVLSPQEIQATVPIGATTGLIRVATVDGESFSAIAFTVTRPADLRVTEVLSTNFATPPQVVTYTTTVTNAGPSIQTGVTLTNTFHAGLALQSAVPSQGNCGIAGNVVACALGIITNNHAATVTITVNVTSSGVFTNSVTVRSIEGDPQPGNNTVNNTLVAATLAERTLDIKLLSAPPRAVVTWPSSPVPFRLQTTPNFPVTGAVWSALTPLPVPVNGTNRFTNASPTAPGGFYRLRYP
jgi:uncharacterized repeat protein (TIGR01451 family)